MSGEYDLKIVRSEVGGVEQFDLEFGPDGEPVFLSGADAIAQDVGHRLLDSGLVTEMVAAEGGDETAALTAIALNAEADTRIRPGSAVATQDAAGDITVKAKTMEGASIQA